MVHQLPGRPGRPAAWLPHARAVARRGDGAGHAGLRPVGLIQPAGHRRPRPGRLRDVPGGPAVVAPLAGAIAAGAFFGLSAMLTYQAWYHLNIAYGTVFLPLTLEAAVRLRRGPTIGRGVILGVVIGASALA